VDSGRKSETNVQRKVGKKWEESRGHSAKSEAVEIGTFLQQIDSQSLAMRMDGHEVCLKQAFDPEVRSQALSGKGVSGQQDG